MLTEKGDYPAGSVDPDRIDSVARDAMQRVLHALRRGERRRSDVLQLRVVISAEFREHSKSVSTLDTDENPIIDVSDRLPITTPYNDEIYLSNRILAFERDGWKCVQCGSRDNLQAHHVKPVPKGQFDSSIIHHTENLQTLCASCHFRVPKTPNSN